MAQSLRRAGTAAAQGLCRVCRQPGTPGADWAEAPAVDLVVTPQAAVGLRRAVDHHIRAGVVARRVRPAVRQAQQPATTENHGLRLFPMSYEAAAGGGLGIVAAEGAAELHRAKTEFVAKLVGGLR